MGMATGCPILTTLVLLFFLINCEIVASRTYIVGDGFGWTLTIDEESWPRGKHFHAGDILVFNYDYQLYDVVVVDKRGYDTCTVTRNSRTFESGHDRIRLGFGANYFIDSDPDNCAGGMKMAINATRPPTPF